MSLTEASMRSFLEAAERCQKSGSVVDIVVCDAACDRLCPLAKSLIANTWPNDFPNMVSRRSLLGAYALCLYACRHHPDLLRCLYLKDLTCLHVYYV